MADLEGVFIANPGQPLKRPIGNFGEGCAKHFIGKRARFQLAQILTQWDVGRVIRFGPMIPIT